jgi:hypothetical protein
MLQVVDEGEGNRNDAHDTVAVPESSVLTKDGDKVRVAEGG